MDFLNVLLIIFLLLVAAIMVVTGISTYENSKKIERLREDIGDVRSDAAEKYVTYDADFRAVKRKIRTIEAKQIGMEEDRK